ncbi:MAG: amidohydrolase [Clostridia bacterium]|nr:amidohydrolase [Clostridia bacterium]
MQNIITAVEKHRALMLAAERRIWSHPETGYKEYKTTAYMAEQFEKLGYKLTYADGIPGFYTVIDTGREGPEVMILAELDSVICPTHPDADPETGAVHACGHNAQCAALLGIAAALTEPGITDSLCGRIRLCTVPAEELLEIEYRLELKAQGKIKYMGGKSEFLSRGYFDGVDIAFMVHTSGSWSIGAGSVGCIAKNIIYKGVAAHAGASPWEGKNALYAATCGLNAANALRETFHDSDHIRFHPIITAGGSMVNAIPERAQIESYVRGKTFEAMEKANKRINQALIGAALSLGNNIEIIDIPGYAPHINSRGMIAAAKEAANAILPEINISVTEGISSGSTDMGDLSCVMPIIHPYCGGAKGKGHGNDYQIINPEAACVSSAKWQLALLTVLLRNDAEKAKEIIAGYTPKFPSKEAYLAYMDSLNRSGDRIIYRDDGTAEIRL